MVTLVVKDTIQEFYLVTLHSSFNSLPPLTAAGATASGKHFSNPLPSCPHLTAAVPVTTRGGKGQERR